eukprot:2271378-Rhodomonas_salina.1
MVPVCACSTLVCANDILPFDFGAVCVLHCNLKCKEPHSWYTLCWKMPLLASDFECAIRGAGGGPRVPSCPTSTALSSRYHPPKSNTRNRNFSTHFVPRIRFLVMDFALYYGTSGC